MDINKMITSKELCEKFGFSIAMITNYGKQFNVQKYGSSYLWTPEQVEMVRQRIGKVGNTHKEPRALFRDCAECEAVSVSGKKRYCTLANREIGRNVKKSPRFCPKGYIIPYTKSTQSEE